MTTRLAKLLSSDATLGVAMEHVRSALQASDFATAAGESLAILERQPSYLPALLTLAWAIQLARDEATLEQFSLEDVRAALEKASHLQADTDDAEHELVRFLYAVDDNSEAALELAERAIAARSAQLRDLLAAKVEILQDLGRKPEAKSAARAALKLFPNDAEFKAALR